MNKILFCVFSVVILNFNSRLPEFEDGDIIFQTSRSAQSKAVQLATGSKWSHCGILFHYNGKPSVLEAIEPVKITPLASWIARGDGGHYVIKRYAGNLGKSDLKKMKAAGQSMLGKHYDLYFEWSDDRIYCSELIWKLYKSAGIELSGTQRLKDFNLNTPAVSQKLRERYGKRIPINEKVVSPAALFASKKLVTIAKQ